MFHLGFPYPVAPLSSPVKALPTSAGKESEVRCQAPGYLCCVAKAQLASQHPGIPPIPSAYPPYSISCVPGLLGPFLDLSQRSVVAPALAFLGMQTHNAALPKKEGTNFAGPFCPAQSQTGRCWRPRANQTKSSASRGMGCSVGAAPTSIAGLLSACVSFIQAWVLRPSSHMLGRPEGQGLPSPGIPKRL